MMSLTSPVIATLFQTFLKVETTNSNDPVVTWGWECCWFVQIIWKNISGKVSRYLTLCDEGTLLDLRTSENNLTSLCLLQVVRWQWRITVELFPSSHSITASTLQHTVDRIKRRYVDANVVGVWWRCINLIAETSLRLKEKFDDWCVL